MRWLIAVGLLTLFADQVTKYLAVRGLTTALDANGSLVQFYSAKNLDNSPIVPGQPYKLKQPTVVLESFWSFRYVENPGAAWGMLSSVPERFRRPFFYVTSLFAIGFIVVMFRRLPKDAAWVRFALALVLGGALGNLADRVARGYVIDFIDWHWFNQPGLRWPTFNVADVAITLGVLVMLADSLRKKAPAAAVPATTPVESEGKLESSSL